MFQLQANDLRRDLNIAKEVNGRLRDEGTTLRADAEALKRQFERMEQEKNAALSQQSGLMSDRAALVDEVDKLRRQVLSLPT